MFCFLAPLLFLGFAQLTIAMNKLERLPTEAAGKSGKASDASRKLAKTDAIVPMNPIDEADDQGRRGTRCDRPLRSNDEVQ